MREMSETEKAWLAAAIDGEGSLCFIKHYNVKHGGYARGYGYRSQLSVANCCKAFVDRVKEIIGGGIVGQVGKSPLFKDGTKMAKPGYRYDGRAMVLRSVLIQVYPYLIIKRRQAELLIEALVLLSEHHHKYHPNDARLEEIYAEIKRLNSKGTAITPRVRFKGGC